MPGFSAMVIATMALGIGLDPAVFSLLDALLLRPPRGGLPRSAWCTFTAQSPVTS